MKILNFGSLNIDYVYSVDHFVGAGETISAKDRNVFCGGKGLNQSVAMANAGLDVFHAGCVGENGRMLLDALTEMRVDTRYILQTDGPDGHTVIQVDRTGQNCIIVYGGANRTIPKNHIDHVLEHFSPGDFLVLQNEINGLRYTMDCAARRGMQIVFNPSPYEGDVETYPLEKVSCLVINEIEGSLLAKTEKAEKILDVLGRAYPRTNILLTLGKEGSIFLCEGRWYRQSAYPAKTVDTTAAGDTFLGYFVRGLTKQLPLEDALDTAARAAAIAVSISGAACSIPKIEDVLE